MRIRLLLIFLCGWLLVSCSRTDPQVELDNTVSQLQTALEAKNANDVLDLLYPGFYAQQPSNNADWVKQTMTVMFFRYKNIKIIALKKQNTIDPNQSDRALTEAEVTVTGAEGLIPNRADFYRVQMEWRQVDGKWKLYRMHWQ